MSAKMNKQTIDIILPPKPEARPRIYAYAIDDVAHTGLLKIGQTSRDVRQRIAEQLKTAAIENYRIELDEFAERDDGTVFSDHEVRAALRKKKFENHSLEWMRCSKKDVITVLSELRTGQRFTGSHDQTFPPRREQREAVKVTYDYFRSRWAEDSKAVPRFLKTFTAYQLAKKMDSNRVLVLTFKPAVEDAWQTDLESHKDFDGWHYLSRNTKDNDPTKVRNGKPLVYFGSFQDLLGRDGGNIKSKNKWLHKVQWDLVKKRSSSTQSRWTQ
jgi:T5orf172 domain